jgi:hypothetical protein
MSNAAMISTPRHDKAPRPAVRAAAVAARAWSATVRAAPYVLLAGLALLTLVAGVGLFGEPAPIYALVLTRL